MAKYAEWVGDLAAEFGTTDEKLTAGIDTPNIEPLVTPQIVQSWLLKEAAEAQLSQARHSLKLGLGAHLRFQEVATDRPTISMAELARSLHTDRSNLSRAAKLAAADAEVMQLLDSIESM